MKTLPLALLAAISLTVLAQDALNPHERVVRAASGVFDMSREPRRFPFLLILDQETLKYPSFWVGTNARGSVTFNPETDLLTGGLDLNTEGSFTLLVTNSTRKNGMEDTLPGGPWMQNTRERNLELTFENFTEAKLGEVRRGRDGNIIEVLAQARGKVSVDGKEAPFEGKARFLFAERTPNFTLHAQIEFEGAPLGLEGPQAGPIQASVSTLSPLGDPPPARPATGADPFGDLGF